MQLHGFSDASETTYMYIYLSMEDLNGAVHTSMVIATCNIN